MKYILEVYKTNKPLLDPLLEEVLPSLHLDSLVLDLPCLVEHEHVLVVQHAPLHDRGVLRAELLVLQRRQLLLVLQLPCTLRCRLLQLVQRVLALSG